MEINLPLDKTIGAILLLFCSSAILAYSKNKIINTIKASKKLPSNLWHSKKTLATLWGFLAAPHALALTLKGFPIYAKLIEVTLASNEFREQNLSKTENAFYFLFMIFTAVTTIALAIGTISCFTGKRDQRDQYPDQHEF